MRGSQTPSATYTVQRAVAPGVLQWRGQMNQRQSGYSLPEMLVVIAIIGIVTMVSIPAFISIQRTMRLKATSRNFATDLRMARARAVTRHRDTKIGFVVGADAREYTVYENSAGTWHKIGASKYLEPGCYFAGQTNVHTDRDLLPDYDVVFRPDGTIIFNDDENGGTVTISSQYNVGLRELELGRSGGIKVN